MSFASPYSQPRSPRFSSWLRRPFAIAALGVSLLAGAMAPAVAIDEPQAHLTDGVYVFGESAEAGQLGTTYMVMSVAAGQITGGFYQPSSSFDCFRGEVADNELALTVIDSYAQTEHPLVMALESTTAIASSNAAAGEWVPSGFQAIADLSDTDRHVLQVCSGQS